MGREQSEVDPVAHGVWDEPVFADRAGEATGSPYAAWVSNKANQVSWLRSWGIAFALALIAGPWSVLATFLQSGAGSGAFGLILLIVVGPLVEEVMKISAILMAVEIRPYLFKSGAQIMAAACGSGLLFAAIENALYIHVYVADPDISLIEWRLWICSALHTGCSLVAGLGVRRVWIDARRSGSRPNPAGASPALILAATIHGGYNLCAIFLNGLFQGK